jgi:very-short-patch-repair endonuclease
MDLYQAIRQSSDFIEGIEIPDEARHSFALSFFAAVERGIGGLWFEPGSAEQRFTADDIAYCVATRYAEMQAAFNGNLINSPIERRLFGSLLWMNFGSAGYARLDEHAMNIEPTLYLKPEQPVVYITPQYSVDRYRVDFLVWFVVGESIGKVAIECDGHDFHEKTKEQAAKDKRRDRDLLASEIPVMRFTGSEIFRDSHGCAKQVESVVAAMIEKLAANSLSHKEAA